MANIDYLKDEDNDLLIENGDFVKGDATDQHISDIIKAVKGDFKESPTLGLDAERLIESNLNVVRVESVLRRQLKVDGFRVKSVTIEKVSGTFNINIDAE